MIGVLHMGAAADKTAERIVPMDLMILFKSVILGIVEGVTEFLPISSTGHMIIVGRFINFEGGFARLFEIVIQLGAILAIMVLFRRKIAESFRSMTPGGEGFRLWSGLALAFVPSGIMGLLLHKKIEEYMMTPAVVACALVAGGLWMIFAERKYRSNSVIGDIDSVGYRRALVIGCFQCLAVLWPGFSRSAATIIGGWIMGLSSVAAAEFSFFLAIPTMIIATGYSLLKTDLSLGATEIVSLATGFAVSFAVALVVVDRFIAFLKTRPMRGFAIYRIILGLAIMGLFLMNVL
jgi:undecaprenyl-diphosphatase